MTRCHGETEMMGQRSRLVDPREWRKVSRRRQLPGEQQYLRALPQTPPYAVFLPHPAQYFMQPSDPPHPHCTSCQLPQSTLSTLPSLPPHAHPSLFFSSSAHSRLYHPENTSLPHLHYSVSRLHSGPSPLHPYPHPAQQQTWAHTPNAAKAAVQCLPPVHCGTTVHCMS